ncbi:hypothetical protein B0H10DRAFT_1948692 [Mycena sp. CBHHK59/15]|nr:hypothetical protein B0H10DRAFT_1948692 [Mycena sp. CBHHK59/15]
MPPTKKQIRDRVACLHGRLPSPKKAIKHVVAIALSPVKVHPEKKHRHDDPDNHHSTTSSSIHEPEPSADKENEDHFREDTNPAGHYWSEFHQGSTPESPTGAPMAFGLKGKLFTANNTGCHPPDSDDDHTSIHTFPTPHAPSVLAESDENDDLDDEIVPPELDELCVPDAGTFGGDGYPCPAPPKTFVEKMAALGTKQALAAAPDITLAKAALTDIEPVLRGPSRGKSGAIFHRT